MNYDNPQLVDALAAEYVLGTLRGGARRRFERWRSEAVHVEQRVRAWEERLIPLTLRLTPIAPSPDVWPKIVRRLDLSPAVAPARSGWWRQTPLRALAAALVLCAVLGGGFGVWRLYQGGRLEPVATIASEGGPAAWRIEIDRSHSRLRAVALAGVNRRPGHSFELWALPPGKVGAPVSLGVLPDAGHLEHALSTSQLQALLRAAKVAVSLEPPGGSPTGAPTGPVLFVADRLKIV